MEFEWLIKKTYRLPLKYLKFPVGFNLMKLNLGPTTIEQLYICPGLALVHLVVRHLHCHLA